MYRFNKPADRQDSNLKKKNCVNRVCEVIFLVVKVKLTISKRNNKKNRRN